jgi:nucleoside-diphosphate kinase
MEQTLVVLKPDAVQRSLVGEIISRFEKIGLKIVAMKMLAPSEELVNRHYTEDLIPIMGNKTTKDWDAWGIPYDKSKEQIGTEVLKATRDFMRSSPVVAMVLEGDNVVEVVRKMVGSTGPKDSAPGTIRGDYAHVSLGRSSLAKKGGANLVHASGEPEEAKAEIALWFTPEELMPSYRLVHEHLTHA